MKLELVLVMEVELVYGVPSRGGKDISDRERGGVLNRIGFVSMK
jgi:hypothetical protein